MQHLFFSHYGTQFELYHAPETDSLELSYLDFSSGGTYALSVDEVEEIRDLCDKYLEIRK